MRDLGIERTQAQHAVKIANITPEAKDAAREAGIDNNQTALLKVAAAPDVRSPMPFLCWLPSCPLGSGRGQ